MSCECSKSEVDLFTIPPTQTTIENGKWVEYFPLTNITDATPIQFHLQWSTDEYTDLSQSLLHLQVKVVNGDGTPLGDDAQVAPTNHFMHSLFSDVDMMLNDRQITPPTNTYPYRSILETLLTDWQKRLRAGLYAVCIWSDTRLVIGGMFQSSQEWQRASRDAIFWTPSRNHQCAGIRGIRKCHWNRQKP